MRELVLVWKRECSVRHWSFNCERMPVINLQLKAHTVSSYNSSIGLMFACVGRGRHHYKGKRNVESAAFRRHFPKTPLLGYFGNGEIGFKLLPGNIQCVNRIPFVMRSDTIVSTVTCYWLDGSEFKLQLSKEIFLFHTHPDWPWGPPSVQYDGHQSCFPGINWWGFGIDYPHLCSVQVNNW
jgi:hypothetical protein